MQQTLEWLLGRVGEVRHKSLRYPRIEDVATSDYAAEVDSVYRRLGGILPSFPLNLRSWDMEFDGIAVELDEYLHFNRYRAVTLDSPAYSDLPRFPLDAYRRYSALYEDRCLTAGGYGKKWSNESCQSQFGAASKPKDLSGSGAPRWKQRAFYDFVKDFSPLTIGVSVARIAVWDEVNDVSSPRRVDEVLLSPLPSSGEALADLIKQRVIR